MISLYRDAKENLYRLIYENNVIKERILEDMFTAKTQLAHIMSYTNVICFSS